MGSWAKCWVISEAAWRLSGPDRVEREEVQWACACLRGAGPNPGAGGVVSGEAGEGSLREGGGVGKAGGRLDRMDGRRAGERDKG